MDDVQLDPVPWLVVAAGSVKAAVLLASGVWWGLPLSVAVLASRRFGTWPIAVALLPVLTANHAVLLFSAALIVGVFPDGRQRLLLYRAQLAALYLFAAVAKMSPEWLLGATFPWFDVWLFSALPFAAITVGTVVVELTLAWAVVREPRLALWLGLPFHAAVTVGMAGAVPDVVGDLVIFNVVAAGMLWAIRGPQRRREPQPAPR